MWRVPKDRGAPAYLSALVHKLMVKHGWPAKVEPIPESWGDGFLIRHVPLGDAFPPDFGVAAEIAVRIVGRTYGVDFSHEVPGVVLIPDSYTVSPSGVVSKVKI